MVVRCKHDWNPGRTVTNPVLHAERFSPSDRAPMVRCADFYAKWERDPNWCVKCPDAVSKIDKYIELVGEFEAKGIPRDQTFVGLPEGAARPLFGIRDEGKRQKAISHVEKALTRTTPTGGQYTKKLTKTDVEKIVNNIEVHPHARGRDVR
jgi:hypothetical protein